MTFRIVMCRVNVLILEFEHGPRVVGRGLEQVREGISAGKVPRLTGEISLDRRTGAGVTPVRWFPHTAIH